jgi:hypothetical protein
MPNKPFTSLRTAALTAAAGGSLWVFTGAIQAVHGDFGGTHNTIDSTAEYLVTGGFALAMLLCGPVYRHLGRMAGARRAGLAAMGAQMVLGTVAAFSVTQGEDAAFFNTVAPICLLTWLAGSVLIARGLRRNEAVPAAVALALPALVLTTIPLSMVGGPMLTGAFWIVVGPRLAAGATATRPAAQPA